MKRIVHGAIVSFLTLPLLAASADASEAGYTSISPRSNAGYVMSGLGVHGVAASWTTPNVQCGERPSSVRIAVELADDESSLLTLGVDVDCTAGEASYDAWLQFQETPRSRMGDVSPGDVVQVSLGARDDGYSAVISDVTKRWVVTLDGGAVLHPTQVAVVVARRFESDGRLPLASFGNVPFTGVRVDGRAVKRPFKRLTMRPRGGAAPVVRVSPLERPSGAFSVTRLP